MSHTPVWPVRITGEGDLIHDQIAVFRAWCRRHTGARMEMIVRKRGTKRSADQNRLLWALISEIAAEAGYDAHEHEQLHYMLLCERFGTWERTPGGHLSRLFGRSVRVPKKTSSQLTTVEFTEYLDWLARFAAEHFGVVVQLPGD